LPDDPKLGPKNPENFIGNNIKISNYSWIYFSPKEKMKRKAN
jgi:hypothetical protein